ncbi:MAG: hypothetical protein Q9185_005164 [Variospora sp. 1 TL-2023]
MPSGTIKTRKYNIGIVGAGSAGLFTRLIFDHLKQVYGLDVEYEILEANDNNRLGGRLYIDYFDNPAKQPHPQLRLPPSYNIDDPIDKPGVLLASYTWSQEGQRIVTLNNNNSKAEYDNVREIIEKHYETRFAYDWYADPGTTSAFAYFDPGQFRNMYPYIVASSATTAPTSSLGKPRRRSNRGSSAPWKAPLEACISFSITNRSVTPR